MADRSAGRRAYDREIDPNIENYVEERLRETRHEWRGELAVVATAVQTAALKSTEEHGVVRGELRSVREGLEALRQQNKALAGQATAMRNWMLSLGMGVIAALGVIAAFMH